MKSKKKSDDKIYDFKSTFDSCLSKSKRKCRFTLIRVATFDVHKFVTQM